ncbi:MAG TPA: caspase family protein, partial [Gemmataceae bacterium]|nr:caspase family protein [Gemmataceae bacterium]
MSLYWSEDEAGAVQPGPRLHALVVAVGGYPYLKGPQSTVEGRRFGLSPLTTTLHTGRYIAEWLTGGLPGFPLPEYKLSGLKLKNPKGYHNPDIPLGTVEVVQSPAPPDPADAPSKLTRLDGKSVDIGPATMAGIDAAFNAWYARCHARADNVALFYFAGHGLGIPPAQFLLASDFQHPQKIDPWENAIDFTRLRLGMWKCQARTQLFFVDACRERLFEAAMHVDPQG